MEDDVERVLSAIRDCHPDMHLIYKFGGCYRLYLLLRVCWPEAEAWWDRSHVYTKIGKVWYDIDGKHICPDVIPMPVKSQALHHRWISKVHVTLDEEYRDGNNQDN